MGRAILVLGLAAIAAARAHAGPAVTAEGGGEIDTNVQRVETGDNLDTERIAAPVIRLGAKLEHRVRIGGGVVAYGASALARLVADLVTSENVALLAGDLRFQRPLGDRGVSAGFALQVADATPLDETTATRTFRTVAADGVIVMRHAEDKALSIAAGGRAFEWKADPAYDYAGPALTARFDAMLWQPAGGARSVELAVGLGYEGRGYDATAFVSVCPETADPSPMCFAPTMRRRHDRYQRASVEVTWVDRAVVAGGYQLAVIDSNSYGQSLVRHRFTASVTMDLPWRLYGTALGILQIDQYLDGLIVQKDLLQQQFTSLDDENRSSLQVRIARHVTEAWSIEGRLAMWRNLGGADDTAFARELVYLGAVYSR